LDFAGKVAALCLARKFNSLPIFKHPPEQEAATFLSTRMKEEAYGKTTFHLFVDDKTLDWLSKVFRLALSKPGSGKALFPLIERKLHSVASGYHSIDLFHWLGCLRLTTDFVTGNEEFLGKAGAVVAGIVVDERAPFVVRYSARQIGLILWVKSQDSALASAIDSFDEQVLSAAIQSNADVQRFLSLYFYYYYDFSDGVCKKVKGVLDAPVTEPGRKRAKLRMYKPMLIAYLALRKALPPGGELDPRNEDGMKDLLTAFESTFASASSSHVR